MPQVILTPPQTMIGAHVGIMRQVQNIKMGNADKFGAYPKDGWLLHIEGCLSEMAVAKYLGLYWDGSLGNWKAADVGKLEVRSTTYPKGRLVLHNPPKDSPDSIFISIRGVNGVYNIVGWMRGVDGQHKDYWEDPTGKGRHAYFVPDDKLHPMEELRHD